VKASFRISIHIRNILLSTTMQILSYSLLATFAIASVSSLGINCRGSAGCILGDSKTLSTIQGFIDNGVDQNFQYSNGQQIACSGDYCAFLQNSGGASGSQVISLINDIVNHGCSVCGSVPTGFPGSNDVSQGELTVNFVSNQDCQGVCVGHN